MSIYTIHNGENKKVNMLDFNTLTLEATIELSSGEKVELHYSKLTADGGRSEIAEAAAACYLNSVKENKDSHERVLNE